MRRGLIGLVGLVLLLPGCSARVDRSLDGTGSTFVAPLFDKWAGAYQGARGVKVVYESIGSGIGFDRWKAGLFDFCCSDAPLTDKQLGEAKANRGEVVHIPLVIGAVVPVYNLHLDGDRTVIFNGAVLSEIYLGNIKKWNDKALKDLNPDLALPDLDIVVVHRQDASGTTYIWTDFLNKINGEKWPISTSPSWPTGEGAFGNAGVATLIQSRLGSIGYVSLQEAETRKLSIGKYTRSGAGTPVQPVVANAASVSAAVNSLKQIPDDLRFSITNASGDEAWPMCGVTWAIVSLNPSANRGPALKDFLKWATHEDGQKIAEELHYVRLTPGLVERVDKQLERITVAK